MAGGLGRVDIDVRASVAKYDRDLRDIERLTRRNAQQMQRWTDRANQRLSRFGVSLRGNMEGVERNARGVNSQLDRMGTLLAAVGGFAAARQIVGLADQYTTLSARIRLVIRDGEQFADVQNDLFQTAQRLRAPLAELTGLYVRVRQATGAAHEEARNLVDVFSQTLVISGAGATEAASFMTQVSQALGEGMLRAEELNTVLSTNPRFVQLLADYLGVATTEIRRLSREGKITSDVMRGAAANAGDLSAEFGEIPLTVSGAMTQLRNAVLQYVGETDSGLGASARMAQGISLLARNFEELADAILLVGGAMGLAALGRGVSGAVGGGGNKIGQWFDEGVADYYRQFDRLDDRIDQLRQGVAHAHNARFGFQALIDDATATIRADQKLLGDLRSDLARYDAGAGAGRAPIPGATRAGPLNADGSVRDRAQILREITEAQERLTNAEKAHALYLRQMSTANDALSVAQTKLNNAVAEGSRRWSAGAIAAKNLSGAWNVLKNVGGSLVNFLGGPWGIAFLGAAGSMHLLSKESERTARAVSSVEGALAIIASATPVSDEMAAAVRQAAETQVDAAADARDLARATRDAADAAKDLGMKSLGAVDGVNAQADAARGLAIARNAEAIATLELAIAQGELAMARLPNDVRYLQGMVDTKQAGARVARREGRVQAADNLDRQVAEYQARLGLARSQMENLPQQLPAMRRGLDLLRAGLLDAGGSGGSGGAGGDTAGGRDQIRELQLSAELNLARLRLDWERVAALEDQLEVERRAEQYRSSGLKHAEALAQAAGEVAAERRAMIANQQREFALAQRQWEIDVLRAREQESLADAREDALEIEERALDIRERFGVSEEEATRRAREYVTAMREAADAARDRARAEEQLDRALQLAEAEGHYARSEELRRQAEIAQNTGRYQGLGYDRETAAAMATRDADQLRAATARGELRMAFEQALFAAASGGDWKEALANSLRQAAEAGFARAIDFIYDLLYDAARRAFAQSSGGQQSFWGQVASYMLTGSSGGGSGSGGGGSAPRSGSVATRANGGNVGAGSLYKVGEIGPELFAPGMDGQVITNRQMRNAMSGAAAGRQKMELVVDARTDGSVDLRIAQAEQRATVNGAALGAKMVGKGMAQRQSK